MNEKQEDKSKVGTMEKHAYVTQNVAQKQTEKSLGWKDRRTDTHTTHTHQSCSFRESMPWVLCYQTLVLRVVLEKQNLKAEFSGLLLRLLELVL